MVAIAGNRWKLAPCLIAMVDEADRIAPHRSTASDGSVGDLSHKARVSDHNPSGGFVHAVDLTYDPKGGFDAHAWARRVASRVDPRIEYIISNRQIWERQTQQWRKYTGINPHTHHAHFSVRHTAAARNNLAPWFSSSPVLPPPPVISVPFLAKPIQENHSQDEEDDMTFIFQHNGQGNPTANGAAILVRDGWRFPLDSQTKFNTAAVLEGVPVRVVNEGGWQYYMSTTLDGVKLSRQLP